VIGKSGQRFGRCKSHADYQPGFLSDTLAHLLAECLERDNAANPDNVQKRLINGVNVLTRSHLPQYGHHAC